MAPAPSIPSCRRVLIVKLSALGDVTHALPVASALKAANPEVEIDWVAEPMAAPIVERCTAINRLYRAPKDRRLRRMGFAGVRQFLSLIHGLRSRSYDIAMDLQGLTKSAVLARASGARHRLGYDWLRELAPALVQRVRRRSQSLHIVDQLLDVAVHLGAPDRPVRFGLAPAAEDLARVTDRLEAAGWPRGAPFLVLNPTDGGGGGDKGITPEAMAETIRRVHQRTGLPWLLIGGAGDRTRADDVLRLASIEALDLVGQTSIHELIAVISLARAHLSGDTGSAHIAAALGTPPVAVYGRSNIVRVGPYGYTHLSVNARCHCSEPCRQYHARSEINVPAKCRARQMTCIPQVGADLLAERVLQALDHQERTEPHRPAHPLAKPQGEGYS